MGIFPRKNHPEDEKKVLDLDEFESGWPGMRLDHLCFVISAILGIMEGKEGNDYKYSGAKEFHSAENWPKVRTKILASIFKDGEEDKEGKKKTKTGGGADKTSWWALNSRLGRLRKLNVFDTGESLRFADMLQPGRVTVVDLSDLENSDVRNLAIAEILRGIQLKQEDLYTEAVARGQTPTPVNVIVEEAHEFLSVHRIREMPILREQIEKIAKRGRKRYLGLTFVTQLPSHLPDEVLALVNNWVLHKITDQDVIRRLKRMVPGVDDSMWGLVPSLAAGQALVSYTHMKRPLIASIDPAPAMLRMTD
ncbi:MAG: ATP-binding protein [Candidatus Zixiibacteriota bacterium]